jgi:tetratricopeptide (TPR) repeat protein
MNRRSSLALLFSIGLWLSSAQAQVPSSPQPNGQDYFTADKSGGSYLSIVEKNHVRTIPDWIKMGRLNDAIGDIKYTLDRFPNHPVSLQQLSMVAQMTKNIALGASYFERAVALFPQYALTRAQYGLFLVSTNNIDAAIENLNQSIEMDPKLPAGYAGLAHAYAKKGNMEQARAAAQKARELGFKGKLPNGL